MDDDTDLLDFLQDLKDSDYCWMLAGNFFYNDEGEFVSDVRQAIRNLQARHEMVKAQHEKKAAVR